MKPINLADNLDEKTRGLYASTTDTKKTYSIAYEALVTENLMGNHIYSRVESKIKKDLHSINLWYNKPEV